MRESKEKKLSKDAQGKFANIVCMLGELMPGIIDVVIRECLEKYVCALSNTPNIQGLILNERAQIAVFPETLMLATDTLINKVSDKFHRTYGKYRQATLQSLTPDVAMSFKKQKKIITEARKGWLEGQEDQPSWQAEKRVLRLELMNALRQYEPDKEFFAGLTNLKGIQPIQLHAFTTQYLNDIVAAIGLFPTDYLIKEYQKVSGAVFEEQSQEKRQVSPDKMQGSPSVGTHHSKSCVPSICYTKDQVLVFNKWLKGTGRMLETMVLMPLKANIQAWASMLIKTIEGLFHPTKPQPLKALNQEVVEEKVPSPQFSQDTLEKHLERYGARSKIVHSLMETQLFDSKHFEGKAPKVASKVTRALSFFTCTSKKKNSKSLEPMDPTNQQSRYERKCAMQ